MRATILLCSARETPRFDWACDSIARQDPDLLADTELVCVDAKLWSTGEALLARYAALHMASTKLRRMGVEVTHVPPKPCRWQGPARLTKSDYFALSNARNTGLIVANGERIIALDDCSVVAEDWLAGHLRYPPSVMVAGSFFTYRTASVEDGVVTWGDPGPYGADSRQKIEPSRCRTNGGWAYGLSCSYPLAAAIRANGCDQEYDGAAGSEDGDFGIRMERAGFPCYWDPGILVYQILESHEAVFEHSAWNLNQPVRRKPKERIVRRDGQSHFANEVLAERLVLDDIDRYLPLGNHFVLAEMREHYQRTRSFMPEWFDPIDWRDGEALEDMG